VKITGATTLAELSVLRAKLGVVGIRIAHAFEMLEPVLVIVDTEHTRHQGRGETIAAALDDAIARVEQTIGHRLSERDDELQFCTACGRSTAARSMFGGPCAMPQPDGGICGGTFARRKP